jgi:hypothetical protein
MKYLEVLKQRDLSIENLPKVLQKKIQTLDFHYNELKNLESDEDLDESELEDIEVVKQKIDELDSHISHKVKIFNQVKYDEKLAKISQMTKAKQGVKVEKEIIVESIVNEQEPIAKVVAINQEVQPIPQVPKPIEPIPQAPQAPQQQAPQYEEQQEEEEFERKGDGNPKKMSTGLILMGVGAFFLTWGAVNFFKSRK